MIHVTIIPVLKDNYAYLLQGDNGETAVLDPGEAAPVIKVLEDKDIELDYVLNTHHHGDHIAGNADLIKRYNARLAGSAAEKSRIPAMDILLEEDSEFFFGGEPVSILETPGHTRGHICFYFPQSKIAFTGDTLFLMSCGRLFEGTAEQMWQSLSKIMSLPDDTKIYCGHEYTLASGEFGLSVEPDNPALHERMKDVRAKRQAGKPTMPALLSLEKKTNVFLRAGSAEEFGRIRTLKDNY